MRKQEFIEELRYSLEGKLAEQDIEEVTSDYSDVFENAAAEGKEEEAIAEELGSPARIARTILEEDELKKREAERKKAEERARAAEEEARSARAAEAEARRAEAEAWAAVNQKQNPELDPKYAPFIGRLASMGSRLGAYIVDGLILSLMVIGILFLVVIIPLIYSRMSGDYYFWNSEVVAVMFAFGLMLLILLCCFNVVTALFIWATNGYTPGKWIFKIRVVKLNGEKLSFMDAVLRELIMKGIANGMTSGILNIISFIWGYSSEVNKTVHDIVTETTVIKDERYNG